MTPWPHLQMPSVINRKGHVASARPGMRHRRVCPLGRQWGSAPRVAPLSRCTGEGGTGFVGLVPMARPTLVLVLSAERSSEEEAIPCAGEMLEGFPEESSASSVQAGSDLDGAQEGGDGSRGRGHLEVGTAWKVAPRLSTTACRCGCEPTAGTQLCGVREGPI